MGEFKEFMMHLAIDLSITLYFLLLIHFLLTFLPMNIFTC